MNRRIFFNYVRNAPFGGRLLQKQIDGMNFILDEWDARALSDDRWLAYCLATAFWETAQTMQPIAEIGKGKGRRYGVPGKHNRQVAYGRGYVQLTWDTNYERADKELNLGGRLLRNFDLAMDPKIAASIMFEGMLDGWFTGKKLRDYFNAGNDDPINARRIINGTDKAATIRNFHRQFLDAIKAAKLEAEDVEPEKATERNAQADDVPATRDPGAIAVGGFSLAAIFNSIISNIVENPLQYGTGGLVLIAVGVLVWMYWTGRISFNRVT